MVVVALCGTEFREAVDDGVREGENDFDGRVRSLLGVPVRLNSSETDCVAVSVCRVDDAIRERDRNVELDGETLRLDKLRVGTECDRVDENDSVEVVVGNS